MEWGGVPEGAGCRVGRGGAGRGSGEVGCVSGARFGGAWVSTGAAVGGGVPGPGVRWLWEGAEWAGSVVGGWVARATPLMGGDGCGPVVGGAVRGPGVGRCGMWASRRRGGRWAGREGREGSALRGAGPTHVPPGGALGASRPRAGAARPGRPPRTSEESAGPAATTSAGPAATTSAGPATTTSGVRPRVSALPGAAAGVSPPWRRPRSPTSPALPPARIAHRHRHRPAPHPCQDRHNAAYAPSAVTSSSWLPSSLMRPFSTTAMTSASWAVWRRWAIATTVRPSRTRARERSR